MEGQKKRLAIDAVATLVHTVQEKWEEKKLAAALFMNVKGAFDHVLKGQLFTRMIELGVDGNMVTWTGSFLTDRKIQLVIDRHNNKKKNRTRNSSRLSGVTCSFFDIHQQDF